MYQRSFMHGSNPIRLGTNTMNRSNVLTQFHNLIKSAPFFWIQRSKHVETLYNN